MDNQPKGPERLEVTLLPNGGESPSHYCRLAAYLFSGRDRLIRQLPFDRGERVVIRLAPHQAEGDACLVIGPELKGETPSRRQLLDQGAQAHGMPAADAEGRAHLEVTLPLDRLRRWKGAECTVRGVAMGRCRRDGRRQVLPMGGAIVQIHQLAPWAHLARDLPDPQLEALGADLVAWGTLAPATEHPLARAHGKLPKELRLELLDAALAKDPARLRRLLVDRAPALAPLIQALVQAAPALELPMRQVALARTDSKGFFNGRFFNLQNLEGPPNLYFTLDPPPIEGEPRSMRRPKPVNHNVHWDYDGRSRIALYFRHWGCAEQERDESAEGCRAAASRNRRVASVPA